MKLLSVSAVAGSLLIMVTIVLSHDAAAQCGEVAIEELPLSCCGGLYEQPDANCGGHGSCSNFCHEGQGECCGVTYHSATTSYDPTCADIQSACADGGGLWQPATCSCKYETPVIVDVLGNGFHLTSVEGGVQFQFGPNGAKNQTAWTAGGSDGNAFLVLDRNNDGVIDDGSELFGNFTPQPSSAHPNGFLALAQFDKPENGGNGDGVIDQRDLMFARLRLWVDVNHDGISQPEELHTLPELGIFSISLHYIEMMKEDAFGNTFRYRADVNSNPKDGRPRWAYDVFLASENSGSSGRQQSSPVHCRAEVRRARAAVGRPFSLDDSHDIWLDVTGTAKSLTGNR